MASRDDIKFLSNYGTVELETDATEEENFELEFEQVEGYSKYLVEFDFKADDILTKNTIQF